MPLSHEEQKRLIETGRRAYRMLIPVTGNPNSKPPHRDLWDKGWRLERKKEDLQRNPRDQSRPAFKKPDEQNFTKKHHKYPTRSHSQQKRTGESDNPVITDRLIGRFNRRHQTRA